MSEEIPVQFRVAGAATGRMRNELKVTMLAPDALEPVELATDEGRFHGGEGTAPPPLTYFTAGWASCIMTQIRAFARRTRLELDELEVEGTIEWAAAPQAFGGYEGRPVRFVMQVWLESASDPQELELLVKRARKGCFVEQSLRTDIDLDFRLTINDRPAVTLS